MRKLQIGFVSLLLLTACANTPVLDQSWNRYKFDLSGRSFSISAPRGQFRDVYVAAVDLSKNEKPYVTLLSSAWVFSGLLADQGGMDLIVGLNRAEFGNTDDELLRGINKHLSDAYKTLRPEGIEVSNITRRKLGGREWLCYSISNISSECALRLDVQHYISLSLGHVDNTSSRISARDDLRKRIEESIQVEF